MNSSAVLCSSLATVCQCLTTGCGWCPSDLSCRASSDATCGTCLVPPVRGTCIDSRHPLPLVGSVVLFISPCFLWFVYTRLWRLRHKRWSFTRSGRAWRCKLAWIMPLPRFTRLLSRTTSLESALGLMQMPRRILSKHGLLETGVFRPHTNDNEAVTRSLLGSAPIASARASQSDYQPTTVLRSTAPGATDCHTFGRGTGQLGLAPITTADPGMMESQGVLGLDAFESATAVEAAAKATINAKAAVGQVTALLLTAGALIVSGIVGDAVTPIPMVLLSLSLGIRSVATLQACLPRSPSVRVSRLNAPANLTTLAGCVTALIGSGVLGEDGLCAPLDPLIVLTVLAALPVGMCFSMHTAVERPGPSASVVAVWRSLDVSATRSSDKGGGEYDGAGGPPLSTMGSPSLEQIGLRNDGGAKADSKSKRDRDDSAVTSPGFNFSSAYHSTLSPVSPPTTELIGSQTARQDHQQSTFNTDDDDADDPVAIQIKTTSQPGHSKPMLVSTESGWSSRVALKNWISADEMAVLCWSVGLDESLERLNLLEQRGIAHRRAVAAIVHSQLSFETTSDSACIKAPWPTPNALQDAINEQFMGVIATAPPLLQSAMAQSKPLMSRPLAATPGATWTLASDVQCGEIAQVSDEVSLQSEQGFAVATHPVLTFDGMPPPRTRITRSLSAPKPPAHSFVMAPPTATGFDSTQYPPPPLPPTAKQQRSIEGSQTGSHQHISGTGTSLTSHHGDTDVPTAPARSNTSRRTPSKALRRYARDRIKQKRSSTNQSRAGSGRAIVYGGHDDTSSNGVSVPVPSSIHGSIPRSSRPPSSRNNDHRLTGTSSASYRTTSGRVSQIAPGVERSTDDSLSMVHGIAAGIDDDSSNGDVSMSRPLATGCTAMEWLPSHQALTSSHQKRRFEVDRIPQKALVTSGHSAITRDMSTIRESSRGRLSSGLGLTIANMIEGSVPTQLPHASIGTTDEVTERHEHRDVHGPEQGAEMLDSSQPAGRAAPEGADATQSPEPGLVTSASMPDLAAVDHT